jgi:hypothetical protein
MEKVILIILAISLLIGVLFALYPIIYGITVLIDVIKIDIWYKRQFKPYKKQKGYHQPREDTTGETPKFDSYFPLTTSNAKRPK